MYRLTIMPTAQELYVTRQAARNNAETAPTVKSLGGSGGTTPTQRTPGILTTSTSGTITSGAKSIAIANTGVSTGTVKGVILPSGISIAFSASSADTLNAVAYDATGTTFLITEVR